MKAALRPLKLSSSPDFSTFSAFCINIRIRNRKLDYLQLKQNRKKKHSIEIRCFLKSDFLGKNKTIWWKKV